MAKGRLLWPSIWAPCFYIRNWLLAGSTRGITSQERSDGEPARRPSCSSLLWTTALLLLLAYLWLRYFFFRGHLNLLSSLKDLRGVVPVKRKRANQRASHRKACQGDGYLLYNRHLTHARPL